MAQKVQVLLVDDLDGGVAQETVSFALDGVSYEIDLSTENAEKLREALAPWVGNARRAGGRGGASRRGGAAKARSNGAGSSSRNLADVRSWARGQGYQVSDRGRVSSEIIAAYDQAH